MIEKLKNIFLYAGLNRQEFYSALELFHIENRKMLVRMATFLSVIFFIMLAFTFVIDSEVLQKNRILYLLAFALEFALAYIPYKLGLKYKKIVLPLCYLYAITLYALGIIIGTIHLTDAPTVTFVVLCASMPMMFYDFPVHSNCLTLLAATVYLVIANFTKTQAAFVTDFIDIVAFGVAGIFLNIFIMQSRAHCLSLKQQAEKQNEEIQKLNEALVSQNNDLENRLEKERRDNSIIAGLGSLYYAIYSIDLQTNTFHEITTKSKVKNILGDVTDARAAMRLITEKMVANEDKTEVAVFNNFDTLKVRLAGKTSLSIEYEGATTGWSRAMLVPIAYDENGEITTVLYTTRLINEEKKSSLEQENVRNIYASMNSALWNIEFDRLGEILLCYWSPAFIKMLGFADERDFPAVLESWTNRIEESDKSMVLQKFWSAINDPTNSSIFDVEFRMQKQDGEYFWFHAAGRLTRRVDGSPISFIGVCVDINDRKKMEEKIASQQLVLQNALVDAQRANNAKTTFLNKLSHDIRVPMNSVLGFAELAKTRVNDPEQVEDYLGKITVSANYMRKLADDILDISRVETGTYAIENVPNNLLSIMHEVEAIVLPEMQMRHLVFTAHADLQNEYVLCDKVRLIQILVNMVSNAIGVSKPTEVIELHMQQTFAPQNNVVFYDFRIRNSILNSEIVLRLSFEVCSKEDLEMRNQKHESREPLKGKKILLVEDDALNSEIAKSVLELAGCVVDVAENGNVAVERVRNAELGQYDLILMDLQMPEKDGFEATKEIRSLKRSGISSLPVIAVTASVTEDDKHRAAAVGMDGHIAKPIDVTKLAEVIANLAKL